MNKFAGRANSKFNRKFLIWGKLYIIAEGFQGVASAHVASISDFSKIYKPNDLKTYESRTCET